MLKMIVYGSQLSVLIVVSMDPVQYLSGKLNKQMTCTYLKKPQLTKKTLCQDGPTFTATLCQMQGWRSIMEDAVVYQQLADNLHLFAVCDGHGGAQVSAYVAKMLPQMLRADSDFKAGKYVSALTSVFLKLDELLASKKGQEELRVINRLQKGQHFPLNDMVAYRSGTTCLALLLTKDKYYVANVGDSRAVLSRNYQAVTLSNDHKPENHAQKRRIYKAGGYIQKGRVNGKLALSRALGDFQIKFSSLRTKEEQAVIAVPEVIQIPRAKSDNFVLMACDGVWERYVDSNQKMVDHVKRMDIRSGGKAVIEGLLDELVGRSIRQSTGLDNMSGILIQF